MFRYLPFLPIVILFSVVNSCLNSQTKNKTIQKIVFVDLIKREDAIKYMGGGETKLDVTDYYGDAVKISTYNLRTKEKQSTILDLSPDEEYKFSYINEDEINVYSVFENETKDPTILLKRLDKNSLELKSSEIVLTSIPKNKLHAEDFNDNEILHPSVKSDSVFLRNSFEINEVVSMTLHCSTDTSKFLFNTVFEDKKGNMQVSVRVFDVEKRKILNSSFELGVKRNQFKDGFLMIHMLNNGHVLFSIRDKVNEKVSGWTYFLFNGRDVNSFKVKKNDISNLVVEGEEEMGESWVADSSKIGVLTQYIVFENNSKRVLGKATVDVVKKKITGVRTLDLPSDVKSNSFKVIRFDKDEVFCFDYYEKREKDVEPSKVWKPSKPSNYKYNVFTKTESYVVRLDSLLEKKWSITKKLSYTERTFPCVYRWDEVDGSLIVNLFEPNRETCDIVDVNTGKVVDSQILQEVEEEKNDRIAKAYKIYSAVFGKYIHSYYKDKDFVKVYELK